MGSCVVLQFPQTNFKWRLRDVFNPHTGSVTLQSGMMVRGSYIYWSITENFPFVENKKKITLIATILTIIVLVIVVVLSRVVLFVVVAFAVVLLFLMLFLFQSLLLFLLLQLLLFLSQVLRYCCCSSCKCSCRCCDFCSFYSCCRYCHYCYCYWCCSSHSCHSWKKVWLTLVNVMKLLNDKRYFKSFSKNQGVLIKL